MSVTPTLGSVAFAVRDTTRPLLVLGPSLGTSSLALWQDVVPLLSDHYDLLGWDLPGHGVSPQVASDSLDGMTMEDLTTAVLGQVEEAQKVRGDLGAPFWYAGVSVGGAVGFHLLLDHPDHLLGAALICTAPTFGEPGPWLDRAKTVQASGTPTQVVGSGQRWFAPGFIEKNKEVALRLLGSLQVADRFGYAAVARALASYDVTSRYAQITRPLLSIQGALDPVSPPSAMEPVVEAINAVTPELARLEILDGVAHLAPAEDAPRTAALLRDFMTTAASASQEV